MTCRFCNGKFQSVRADAEYCSRKCRQAGHRLKKRGVAIDNFVRPMHFVYADPPYPGKAKRYYQHEATYAGEVDHRALVERMTGSAADGWALSSSSEALPWLLPMIQQVIGQKVRMRVCAWVKPYPVSTLNYGISSTWEPVIVVGGRQRRPGVRDHLVAMPARHGGELPGRKPIAFCAWLFDLLGGQRGDTLEDVYPGTGIVGRTWNLLANEISGEGAQGRFLEFLESKQLEPVGDDGMDGLQGPLPSLLQDNDGGSK